MASKLLLGLCIQATAVKGSSCSFDHVAALRDSDVASSFDPEKMKGLYFEHGYKDIAQVGASCQILNNTYDPATGILHDDFAVKYGPLPFTIEEIYEPKDGSTSLPTGVYRKSVKAPFHLPGGHLLGLPTAIVKATLSADASSYDSVAIYSCVPALGIEEMIIASRKNTIAEADYDAIVSDLKAKGFPTDKLERVDWSKCNKAQSELLV